MYLDQKKKHDVALTEQLINIIKLYTTDSSKLRQETEFFHTWYSVAYNERLTPHWPALSQAQGRPLTLSQLVHSPSQLFFPKYQQDYHTSMSYLPHPVFLSPIGFTTQSYDVRVHRITY